LLGRGGHRTLTPSFGHRVRAVLLHPCVKRSGFAAGFADTLVGIAPRREAPHAPLTIPARQDPCCRTRRCQSQSKASTARIREVKARAARYFPYRLLDCSLGQSNRYGIFSWGSNGASPGLQHHGIFWDASGRMLPGLQSKINGIISDSQTFRDCMEQTGTSSPRRGRQVSTNTAAIGSAARQVGGPAATPLTLALGWHRTMPPPLASKSDPAGADRLCWTAISTHTPGLAALRHRSPRTCRINRQQCP